MTLLRACGSVIGTGLLASALGGCASIRVDEQGRTHIVGLVWMTLPAGANEGLAANVVRARSLGVSLHSSPDSGSLTLGYSDQTLARIYNNSVVSLPPGAKAADEERAR